MERLNNLASQLKDAVAIQGGYKGKLDEAGYQKIYSDLMFYRLILYEYLNSEGG